jgi:hypothetical protein
MEIEALDSGGWTLHTEEAREMVRRLALCSSSL